MKEALYTAQAQVIGGRTNGHARTDDGRLEVDLRQPKELGGDGEGINATRGNINVAIAVNGATLA